MSVCNCQKPMGTGDVCQRCGCDPITDDEGKVVGRVIADGSDKDGIWIDLGIDREKLAARRRARCKVFQLSRRDLLRLVADYRRSVPDCIIIPDFPAFPPDAVIEDCEFNPWTRCFVMRVWSSTFDPVPDGMQMPVVNDPAEMVWRAVKFTDEQKRELSRGSA